MRTRYYQIFAMLMFLPFALCGNAFAQLTLPETKIVASDGGAGSQLGAVGIDGNTLVLGAFGDTVGSNLQQGSAYIYVRNGTGWTLQQKLTASDGRSGDLFGRSVGISGNTVVIGASQADLGTTAANQGAVYVFVRNGNNVWTQQAKLFASDASGGDILGEFSRIDGDTIIAGARLSDRTTPTTQIDIGAAYIFVRNGTNWTQQAKLMASDGVGGDNFGISCDVSGDTAVVGAWFDAQGINSQQGSAYIFTRNAGQWSQQFKILANDGLAGDWFGISSAIDGNTVVIGARQDNLNPGTPGSSNGQGSAYIYAGSGANWTLQQKITASDPQMTAAFGESCAILGDRIVVGAFNVDSKGAAYLLKRSGTTWTQLTKLTASDGGINDFFADFVALGRYDVVSGSYGDDIGTRIDQGSVYVYSFPRPAMFDYDGDGKSDLSVFRPSAGEWYYQQSGNGVTRGFGFGTSTDKVATADFTGDGKTDIAFWRPSTGEWYVLRSEDSTYFAFPFGTTGDIPVPADYDGDGVADPAVYRPSAQTWFILRSTGGVASVPFGLSSDIPEPADYDGDGKTDVGIYRPSVGQWWNLRSGNGSVFAAAFGSSTDKPVPGDFTGDGKADVAFFRPSNGNWYILRSEDQSFYAFPFGANGDKPVPADYDGDGKFDPAVFRPSEANWYILQSTGGLYIQQYGAANDIPLPGAFVP